MRLVSIFCFLFFFHSCAEFSVSGDPIENSDQIVLQFTSELAKLYPEVGSATGMKEFDSKATVMSEQLEIKEQQLLQQYKAKVEQLLNRVQNPELKMDLLIFRDRLDQGIAFYQLEQNYKVLPFTPISKNIFNHLFPLLRPDSSDQAKKAALARLKMYVSPPGEAVPYPIAYIQYFNHKVEKFPGAHFYPHRQAVEKYLKESAMYVEGVGKLLSMLPGERSWMEDFQKYLMQIQAYDQFVEKRILPYSRKSAQLPTELYQSLLAAQGIDYTAGQLIKFGRRDFDKTYKQFQQLAAIVAKRRNLKTSDSAAVINHLKKEKWQSGHQSLELFQQANQQLENIIKKKKLMSLPEHALKIRIGNESESKVNPVPHLDIPPLRGGQKQAELVIPIVPNEELPFDDFSYTSAVLPMVAHEGRPGHELQFSHILNRPISIIRSRYAQNATNVEGWALYAEDLIYSEISAEQQLVILQNRLWRQARYFLEPQVLTQGLSEQQVKKVLGQIGVSDQMAQIEWERYAFQAPGQAPGHYHGLLEIMELKSKLNKQGKLDDRCFNDTLLSLGLVPFKYIQLMQNNFDPCLQSR